MRATEAKIAKSMSFPPSIFVLPGRFKRHFKYNFISFVLLRHYFKSFNFYRNGELPRNKSGRSGVEVKKENEKFTVVCSPSPQCLKFGHFTLLFCKGRQRNGPKSENARTGRLVLLIKLIVLRRCRCRRRSLKFPIIITSSV